MEDREIEEISKILSEWNPLGNDSDRVPDLGGYRTEAIDIIFHLQMHKGTKHPEQVVMQVLNEAFDLSLSKEKFSGPTKRIMNALGKEH